MPGIEQKLEKSYGFGFLRKINIILKTGQMSQLLEPRVHYYFVFF